MTFEQFIIIYLSRKHYVTLRMLNKNLIITALEVCYIDKLIIDVIKTMIKFFSQFKIYLCVNQ